MRAATGAGSSARSYVQVAGPRPELTAGIIIPNKALLEIRRVLDAGPQRKLAIKTLVQDDIAIARGLFHCSRTTNSVVPPGRLVQAGGEA